MAKQSQQPANGRNTSEKWTYSSGEVVPNLISINDHDESVSPEVIAQIWAERARELAKVPPVAVSGQTKNLLLVRLEDEQYGIEVSYVREIFPVGQLTPVPRTPDFVIGIFSARGRILSVIDLRAFLGLPASFRPERNKIDDLAKIVVVSTDSPGERSNRPGGAAMEVGIFADDVLDMITVFLQDIEPPLTTHDNLLAKYQQGIAPGLIVVLDLESLLNDNRLVVYQEIT